MGGGDKVRVITNGFDPADFEFEEVEPDPGFVLNHIGYLNTDRNPPALWEVLGKMAQEDPQFKADLKIKVIGKTDREIFQHLERQGLSDQTEAIAYVPHTEVLGLLPRAQVLLLLNNNTPNVMGIIPGKTYEYLASGRPILAITPTESDVARVIRETEAGIACDFSDKAAIEAAIKELYAAYRKGELKTRQKAIDRFSRRNATGQIAEQLTEISGG